MIVILYGCLGFRRQTRRGHFSPFIERWAEFEHGILSPDLRTYK
jgi:hypothetical protein